MGGHGAQAGGRACTLNRLFQPKTPKTISVYYTTPLFLAHLPIEV